jgi:hypothetical protein
LGANAVTGLTLLFLAGVLVLNSVLGPLVLDVVSYPITETVENQLIGLELVTAFLVAPWATVAGVAALRGRPAAPIFGFAPPAYAAYIFVQYVLGPEYARYSVTSLADLGIFVLLRYSGAVAGSFTGAEIESEFSTRSDGGATVSSRMSTRPSAFNPSATIVVGHSNCSSSCRRSPP